MICAIVQFIKNNFEAVLRVRCSTVFHWYLTLTQPVKRVQVLMEPKYHRMLKQICAIDDVSMSDFVFRCAIAHIHTRAKLDDHILTLLQREGIELDP